MRKGFDGEVEKEEKKKKIVNGDQLQFLEVYIFKRLAGKCFLV